MIFAKVLYGDNKSVQYDDELNDTLAVRMQELSQKGQKSRSSNHRATIAAPLILNDSNFAQAVQKYPLLVVDFWAPWCGPCRMTGPTIEHLAVELARKAVFGKLNVDENPRVASAFGIQSIPTVAIFKNGQVVDGFVGVASKSQIQSKVLRYADEETSQGGKSRYNEFYY